MKISKRSQTWKAVEAWLVDKIERGQRALEDSRGDAGESDVIRGEIRACRELIQYGDKDDPMPEIEANPISVELGEHHGR